jgi:hypothetical protein
LGGFLGYSRVPTHFNLKTTQKSLGRLTEVSYVPTWESFTFTGTKQALGTPLGPLVDDATGRTYTSEVSEALTPDAINGVVGALSLFLIAFPTSPALPKG